jgi:hypothetical protein
MFLFPLLVVQVCCDGVPTAGCPGLYVSVPAPGGLILMSVFLLLVVLVLLLVLAPGGPSLDLVFLLLVILTLILVFLVQIVGYLLYCFRVALGEPRMQET